MIPKKINFGDTIGVVAPSDPVTLEREDLFVKGIELLKSLNFKIKLGKNIYSTTNGYSATPQEKASDINDMFLDISIKAIICAQGGENSNSVLEYIDYSIIKNNPKIFVGISDITVLLNAINKKVGLITFHGNDLMYGFGRNPTGYDISEFVERFVKENYKIKKNSKWKVLKSGSGEGFLVGGNLFSFLKLVGTEYLPKIKNSILFIEEINPKKSQLESMIAHLKKLEGFDRIKGMVIGHIDGLNEECIDIFLNSLKEFNFPIIKTDDFGHNTPNTVIPIGLNCRVDTEKEEILYLNRGKN